MFESKDSLVALPQNTTVAYSFLGVGFGSPLVRKAISDRVLRRILFLRVMQSQEALDGKQTGFCSEAVLSQTG